VFVLHRACRGGEIPLRGGSGAMPPRFFFASGNVSHFLPHFSCYLDFHVHCWAVFRHMVFADGFLFKVKDLGFFY
jgi:hypothetical protein